MSVALFGLIAVQVYWINNSLKLKEQEFTKSVNEVLREAADVHKQTVYKDLLGIDVIKGTKETLLITSTDTFSIPASEEERTIEFDLGDPVLFEEWTGMPFGSENAHKRTFIQHMQALSNKIEEQKQMHFTEDEVISWVTGVLSIAKVPLSERLNIDLLNKEIKKRLHDRGIDLEYYLGIAPEGVDTIFASNEKVKADLFRKTDYRANLYPENRVFAQPMYLSIYFPKKINYLLRTMQFRMLTSFIFILIIIFSFAFTIWTIFRQKKLSDMKTDFINNMTHEFKTPITTISLAGQALIDPDVAKDQNRLSRFSGVILDESAKLGSQVEKILQMAILDRGTFKLKVDEVNLHDVIEGIAESYELRLSNEHSYLNLNLNAQNPIVKGDEVHLSSLVDNLIDNAIKYCKDYPEVTVETENTKQGLYLTVSDNGIGMSKDTLKKIFDRFYRVPTGNVHNVKGFGLGLAYVKTIVEAHGGKISVHSEPGQGTRFKVFLPFAHQFDQ